MAKHMGNAQVTWTELAGAAAVQRWVALPLKK
jgi:hypothetical protein